MTVKLKSNLCVGPVNISPYVWHCIHPKYIEEWHHCTETRVNLLRAVSALLDLSAEMQSDDLTRHLEGQFCADE